MFRSHSIVANYETNANIATVRCAERSILDVTRTKKIIITATVTSSLFCTFQFVSHVKTHEGNHMIHKYVLVDFLLELLLYCYKGIF